MPSSASRPARRCSTTGPRCGGTTPCWCLAWSGLVCRAVDRLVRAIRLVSFRAFRTDLLYPFVLFLISFMLVRSRNGRLALTLGAAVGTVISLTTTFAAALAPVDPGLESAAPGVLGWLAWKAGEAVDSSTYIAFLAVPLFVVALTSTPAVGALGVGGLAGRLCRSRA